MKKYSLIVILISCLGCYKDPNDYILKHSNSILSVATSSDSVVADGKSMIILTAKISDDADLKTIMFTTTDGNFLDSTTTYTINANVQNDSLLARSYLISSLNVTDYVFVKVSVPSLDTTLQLRFVPAYADSIYIESAINNIAKGYGSEVPLQTYLIRNTGTPSLHQSVVFSAVDDNNLPIGSFIGISKQGSDSSGLINSTFVLRDSTYTGNVYITATCHSPNNLLISTFKIAITN
jgi:hypothetical protein